MYFQSSKKVVDQILKCNIVLIERYVSKCPNVSEKSLHLTAFKDKYKQYFWLI